MPSMLEHESNHLVKMLVAADSGSGKSGALSSLVDAGLNVRVLDFDNGLSVIRGFVNDKSKLANVHYKTLTDDLSLMAARIGIKKAHAFQEAMDLLDKGGKLWGDDAEHIGPVTSWTPRDVLVLDTGLLWGRAEGVLALMEEQDDLAAIPVLVSHQGGRPAWSIRRRIGVCEYAAKPLTPEQLAARIRELVPFQVDDYFPGGIYDDSNLDS